jgi:tetratricopeptide (TPR) repeat protein
MAGLIWREHKLVILVDALDEAVEPDGTNPLASLLSGRFLELPDWIGFVVTSRPDPSVVPYLQGFKPFSIEAGDARNQADLEAYASAEVGPLLPPEDRERLCALLVEKSAGMMLYLRLVAEGLSEGTLQPAGLETLESGLPGLHSRYHAAFEARLRADFRETVQPLLRLVMAAPGPLPLELAREVLAWDRETAVRARAQLGSYLVEDEGGLSLFHKALGDWLASEGAGIYFTDPEPAAKALGEFLWECFDEREEDANEVTQPIRWERFVSDWLPRLWELTDRREDWGGVGKLASWFREKILWKSAEALYRRALEGREKALGAEHSSTLNSVNNLGNLLSEKGDYDGAEVLYRRALEGREKALGVEHPSTLGSVNNLGNLLSDKGDYDGAEVLYRRALEGREKALGAEHPATLRSVTSLGNLLSDKGDYAGAEPLLRRALAGCEKALGAEHPDTLGSVNNLGLLLSDKGDYTGAEPLLRRALAGCEKALGLEHPDTTAAAYGLAGILNRLHRRPDAIALLRRFAILSDDSRDAVAYNLACYECLEGDHEEAKRLIAEHLERHPEKKAQALADKDFAAIREWIAGP